MAKQLDLTGDTGVKFGDSSSISEPGEASEENRLLILINPSNY